MDTMTGQVSPELGSAQAADQQSHLCQACLSVLAQDDLKFERYYPHHITLRDFIGASDKQCYICLWLISQIHEDRQNILRRLANGMTPDYMVVEEGDKPDTEISDPRSELLDCLRNIITTRDGSISETKSSFTAMRIEPPEDDYESHSRIAVFLNPEYKGYFPLDTEVHDAWFKDFWKALAIEARGFWDSEFAVSSSEDLISKSFALNVFSNTESTETWSAVDKLLQLCSRSHSCAANANRDWYPTRLIERMPNERFRIIRSDSSLFRHGQKYVTLSHRWGDNDFTKLTKESLSEFENGLPVAKLRKTFRDAITVAEIMDIPYVWIDSLCIIQSDNKVEDSDWEQEAGKMSEVYSNSFFNISADWGDETNGLFFERTPVFDPPCAIQLRRKIIRDHVRIRDNARRWSTWWTPLLEGPPKLSPDGIPGYIVHFGGLVTDLRYSPLSLRGWVLQERLLAPRVLHLSPGRVSWECGELISLEKAPWANWKRSPFDDFFDEIGYPRLEWNHANTGMNLNQEGKTGYWKLIVRYYSYCELTQQSDRLIAIAGIAKRLASVKGQYVAGLWTTGLPLALLWRAQRTSRSRDPPKDYYAPTFSWAAADDGVELPYEPDEPYYGAWLPDLEPRRSSEAEVIKYRHDSLCPAAVTTTRTEPTGQDFKDHVFGPLKSPVVEIRMRSILRSCRMVPPRLVPAEWSKSRGNSCARPSKGVDDPAVYRYFEPDTTFRVEFDRATDEDVHSDSIVYYYTIIQPSNFSHKSSAGGFPDVEGLFLKPVDSRMCRFERLGLVTHYDDQQADIRQPLGNEQDLPAWSYDETTGKHTFYIV